MATIPVCASPKRDTAFKRPHRSEQMSSWVVIAPLLRKLVRLGKRIWKWDGPVVSKTLSEAIVSTTVYGNEEDPNRRIYITVRLLIGSFY